MTKPTKEAESMRRLRKDRSKDGFVDFRVSVMPETRVKLLDLAVEIEPDNKQLKRLRKL